jgi:flagellar P-ring protein precursor FlgI
MNNKEKLRDKDGNHVKDENGQYIDAEPVYPNGAGPQFGNVGGGQTVVLPSTTTSVNEQKGGFKLVEEAPTIERVAAALNALGVSTRDMMSIFQTMKRAGALQAELILN